MNQQMEGEIDRVAVCLKQLYAILDYFLYV